MTIPVRPLGPDDFEDAHALYADLTNGPAPPAGAEGRAAFQAVLEHPGTAILGAEADGRVVAMATLHILPNMTYGARPYALAENVVTLAARQGRGHGRAVMEALATRAWDAGCYKVMLLTGAGRGAMGFYEKLGFSAEEKFGMVLRW